MNRKFKRKAEKLGLPPITTTKNIKTGATAEMYVVWNEQFVPTLFITENNGESRDIVYAIPAIQFIGHVAKLTDEAFVRFWESMDESVKR